MTSVARTAPRITPAPSRVDLTVVGPARRSGVGSRRGKTFAAVGLLAVVLFASLLASAALRSMLVSGQDQLDETNSQIATTQHEIQVAKAELAANQSPARIAAEAERLGMVATDDQRWLAIEPGSQTPTVPEQEGDGPVNELAAGQP